MNRGLGLFFSLLVMFAAHAASAQNALSPMDRFADYFLTSCVGIECRYEMVLNGTVVKGNAVAGVQGTSYRMTSGGLDFFCDGQTLWILDYEAKEAVIEPAEVGTAGYLSNPAMLFVCPGDNFEVTDSSCSDGKWTYGLSAKKDCGIKKAELFMTSAGILVSGNFILSDGGRMKVNVLSMTSSALKTISYFRPDMDFDSSWVVTDLR